MHTCHQTLKRVWFQEAYISSLELQALIQAGALDKADNFANHLSCYVCVSGLIKENIVVENFHEKLNLNSSVHALPRDLESLLQTIHNLFPVFCWFPIGSLACS